jgi:hypothetical protein
MLDEFRSAHLDTKARPRRIGNRVWPRVIGVIQPNHREHGQKAHANDFNARKPAKS